MPTLIGGPAADWLAARRDDLNLRFARARKRFPTLDGAAVLALVAELLPPLAAPDGPGVDRLLASVYDLILLHAGRQTLAPRGGGTLPAIGLLLREVFPALRARLLDRAASLPGALSNAVENLGPRGEEFARAIARLGPRVDGGESLLDAGVVLAWRLGEARLRRQALEIAGRLPPAAALDALGLGDWPPVAAPLVVAGLAADAWQPPASALTPRTLDGLPRLAPDAVAALRQKLSAPATAPYAQWTVVARVGEFSGFGGRFDEPPLLLDPGQRADRHRLWARCGAETFRLDADVFGYRCVADGNADLPIQLAEKDAWTASSLLADPLRGVRVAADGTLAVGPEVVPVAAAKGATSFAVLERAIALSLGDSHRIRVLAPPRPPL